MVDPLCILKLCTIYQSTIWVIIQYHVHVYEGSKNFITIPSQNFDPAAQILIAKDLMSKYWVTAHVMSKKGVTIHWSCDLRLLSMCHSVQLFFLELFQNSWKSHIYTSMIYIYISFPGENKALTAKKARFTPYGTFGKCRICKSSVHQVGSHYCQGCAYKKGICAMCGKQILKTQGYKQSSV